MALAYFTAEKAPSRLRSPEVLPAGPTWMDGYCGPQSLLVREGLESGGEGQADTRLPYCDL
jgi:hypothetical protein